MVTRRLYSGSQLHMKPGVFGSLATIVVALALGLITSVVPGRIPAMHKSLSLSLSARDARSLSGWNAGVMYFHGGGWILGDKETHDRLVREIATGAQATVVFVEYARSPEAKYPVAIEQAYAATAWVAEHGASIGVNPSRLAVVGEGVGGNLATVTFTRHCSFPRRPPGRAATPFGPRSDPGCP